MARNPSTGNGPQAQAAWKVEIVVIGAGQAGLSAAYHLARRGMKPLSDFVVLDAAPSPGGAWQFRWPTLTLSTVNRIHDLPGMAFSETLEDGSDEVQAAVAVPRYYEAYERKFGLKVRRPVKVSAVRDRGARLRVDTSGMAVSARGLINATGTWNTPNIPHYPGFERFRGRHLHTVDYRRPEDVAGQRVLVVGGGISAIQLLDAISKVTRTMWVTRRAPEFWRGDFTEEFGREVVAQVEERVRAGLPPRSVVSATGLPLTPAIEAMRARGALDRQEMFSEVTGTGVRWADGRAEDFDVILWCTGFRYDLDHLAPLRLTNEEGGIAMTGRLATQVASDPRIHLVGYGPSASTIGANRAGGAAASELLRYLEGANGEAG